MMQRVSCPTMILHGEMDEVIPFHHAGQLRDACQGKPVVFFAKPNMTHNSYRMNEDLLRPLAKFFADASIFGTGLGEVLDVMKFLEDISREP